MDVARRRGAPWPGAVAVSGGGDSIALLLLLADWAKSANVAAPVVLTVDHGLQKNSARMVRAVVMRAKLLHLKAHGLRWPGEKPQSDIEAAAREARYRLMGAWCRKNKIAGLYLAHTLEDQAETFLLRLARGSGIDGLSAMRSVAPLPSQDCEHVMLVRPLLDFRREDLRQFLRTRGETWIDDPMNADPRFARVRVRNAWPALERIGLSAERIAAAAGHLSRAREALDADTDTLIAESCRKDGDVVLLDAARVAAASPEIGLRALASLLMRVSGNPYRPRFERLEALYRSICNGTLKGGKTLHGCRVAPAGRRHAAFGPGTLALSVEAGRGRKMPAKGESREKPYGN